ncbi:MAG: DUF3352 domain-containing protein [Marinilabiliaceae bacterium]|nr:DUF3352 domain-containing protein [Marinilabiliaceae bacterium]
MRNGRVIILITIAAIILICAVFLINRVKRYENNEPLKAIPTDAALIVKTESLKNVYDLLHDDVDFKAELRCLDIIKNALEIVEKIDSLPEFHTDVLHELGDHPFYMSLHPQGKDNVKALFLSEFPNKSKELEFRNYLQHLGEIKYFLSERKYNTITVYTLKEKESQKSFSIVIHQGILLGSSSHLLVESAIRQVQSAQSLLNDSYFSQVKKTASATALLNIYINFSNAPKVLKPIVSKSFRKQSQFLKEQSGWGELDLDLKSDALIMNGFFTGNCKGVYSHLLTRAQPKRSTIHSVLPYDTRSYLSLTFENGADLKERLLKFYEENDRLSNYNLVLEKFKNSDDIDIQNLLFSQMKGEIAIAYTDFNHLQPDNNGFFVLEVKSQSTAREKLVKALGVLNGKGAISPKTIYTIDEDTSYPIYKGFRDNLIPHIFQAFLPKVPHQYFTFVDNYLVFSNTVQQLERFIYANVLRKTLDNKKIYEDYRKHFSGRENLFVFCETGQLASFLSSSFAPLFSELTEMQKEALNGFYGTGLQFSGTGNMIYSTIYTDYKPERASEPRTIWQSLLDSTAVIKPVLVENHYSKEKEVLIQDAQNNLYLINNKGRILWKKVLDGPILSEVNQIDYYRNKKLQYLFNTKSRMYLLDRNGNHVAKYPVTLPSEATNGLSVFDYDKGRNYRIFLATANKKVYLFDKTGNRISGWHFLKTEGTVTLPIQHFRSNDKDYIVFSDDRKNYILNRKGEERVKVRSPFIRNTHSCFYLEGQNSANESLVTTSMKGELIKINLKDGSIQKMELEDIDGTHAMVAYKFRQQLHYVVSTPHSISCFDHNRHLNFSHEFDNEIQLQTDVYQFSANNHKIGVVEKTGGHIFLINSNGKNYKSFPLVGHSRFSIGFLKTSSSRFNLIVGGSNNYLYNYRVE